jgi:extracellular elastinolytic metalloproteinase
MITNVFYWVDWNHDLHYHYGFNEVAGNFQNNNYGRGGDGDDFVDVYVHDTQVGENAFFATPPEGSIPGLVLGIFTDDPTTVTVTSPIALAGDYGARPATFGPALSEVGIQGTVVAALDVVEGVGYTSTDACSAILNSAEINGKIALVDRGICLFVEKVANAQAAGAKGVIVANNVPGIIGGMSGDDPAISIPSVLITQANGNLLRAQLSNNVTASLHTEDLPDRDSSFDSGIIIHEYGHGVSTRLAGGPANSNCLDSWQSGAMGEGWSDFWTVALLTQSSHSATDTRPIGTFALGQPLGGTGMRNFPYSTDLMISPLTYEDIAAINLPHGGGEIWASALLEVFWNLVEVHGFDADVTFGNGGNNIALELVMDALKLQPCNPSFLDARDALLLADLNNNEAANRCAIWEGFAKRGMGLDAYDGVNANSLDVAEDFSVPIECVPEPGQWTLGFAAMLTLTMLRQMHPHILDAGASIDDRATPKST